ncbi:MAG: type II toxin-antitoxin system Phd/YefM family antitoxin [Opitutales bacterium]
MEVKTGELRNQLSRYLKRVRQTGDIITVLDRNRPVAEIRPYPDHMQDARSDVWMRRAEMEAQLGGLDEDIELAERRTDPAKHVNPLD